MSNKAQAQNRDQMQAHANAAPPEEAPPSESSGPVVRTHVARALVFALLCGALIAYSSPPTALVAGILFALCLGNPFPKQGPRVTKRLLQVCVILLGFGMDLRTILRTGLHGWLFAAVTIGTTLLVGYWAGRKLRIHPNTSALISAGTAICGGSAIAAVGAVLAVTESQIALAMGTVFLLNAAALYLFPVLGHAFHLSQSQFGMWSGVAIHDISSVVGATMSYGHEALETATAIKLSRTLWIVPVALGFAMAARNRTQNVEQALVGGAAPARKSKLQIPWFIAFFLLASLTRSFIPAIAQCSAQISVVAKAGLTIVLGLIGASLSLESLRSVGWRAPIQGILLWIFISLVSLLAILCG